MKNKIISIFSSLILIFILFSSVSASIIKNDCGCQNNSNLENDSDNKIKTYPLGLIQDFDEEGYLISNPVELSGDPPKKWDWRTATYNGVSGNWVTSVKNQGNCGSCWAFGAIAVLESVYKIQNKDPNLAIDLSEQYLVSCGTTYSAGIDGCCGGTIGGTMNYLSMFGTVSESCFAYQAIDSKGRVYEDCKPFIPPSYDPVPCRNRCDDWESEIIKAKGYAGLLTRNSIKNAIANYGPVVAGFDVYEDFYDYEGGIYEYKYGVYLGGHIVTLIGYDDDGGYWIAKNSWAEDWGEEGFFKIKYGECRIDAPGNTAYITDYKTQSFSNGLGILNILQNYPCLQFIVKFLLN